MYKRKQVQLPVFSQKKKSKITFLTEYHGIRTDKWECPVSVGTYIDLNFFRIVDHVTLLYKWEFVIGGFFWWRCVEAFLDRSGWLGTLLTLSHHHRSITDHSETEHARVTERPKVKRSASLPLWTLKVVHRFFYLALFFKKTCRQHFSTAPCDCLTIFHALFYNIPL